MWIKSEKLRLLQKTELDIFHQFQKICIENELKYFLLGGTFLGAVRHNGFIPWDDDIDVGMPRRDFEKFIDTYQDSEGGRYRMVCFQRDFYYKGYTPKMVDNSIIVRDNSARIPSDQPAWIDIFPLDGMPNNSVMRKIHKIRLLVARLRLNFSRFSQHVNIQKKNRPAIERLFIFLGTHIDVEKHFNTRRELIRLDRLLKKYSYEKADYVINFMGAYKLREMFPRGIYEDIAIYKFEDTVAPAPKDYNHVLTQIYGNYMKFPDVSERNHHNIEFVKEII